MAVAAVAPRAITEFASDVREGLSNRKQKRLPSKYLYDDLGSVLFEAICLLPEYGLTRAETRILQRNADEIVAALSPGATVVELGSGTGAKTRLLLEAIRRRNMDCESPFSETLYRPIEISESSLQHCERELQSVPGIRCAGLQREYLGGLREVAAHRPAQQPLLVLFLGSSIGNFHGQEGLRFLSQVRQVLRAGDFFLLAADLLKPVERVLPAYDDPTGVTAAFNINLLGRINRELQGDFDLSAFAHQALYNHETNSIEMHLRSLADQVVSIGQVGLRFPIRAGETIWTETSHKYSLAELRNLALATGFRFASQWIDEEWGFAENLWCVA